MRFVTFALAGAISLSVPGRALPTSHQTDSAEVAPSSFITRTSDSSHVADSTTDVAFSKRSAADTTSSTRNASWPVNISSMMANAQQYLLSQWQNTTAKDWPIYQISTLTNTNVTSPYQQDFTLLEVDFLPNNGTRVLSIDNFDGAENTMPGPGHWSGPKQDVTLDVLTSGVRALTWSLTDGALLGQSATKADKVLKAKGISGPWDFITVTLPKYMPGSTTQLNSNSTLFFEVSSRSNSTMSILVNGDGKIYRRTL